MIAIIPFIIQFTIKEKIKLGLKKDIEKYRSELELKNKQIQLALDLQLETMKIQFGALQTDRLDVIKEACNRITEILDKVNRIASYNTWECKEVVDFENKCDDKELDCPNKGIIHYWDKIMQLDKFTRETDNFCQSNQMFFPKRIANKHVHIVDSIFVLRDIAFAIYTDLEMTSKNKAKLILELFSEFNKGDILSMRAELIDEYRLLIGVSIEE
ncbi:MAG: hypothetical protein PHS04_19140 [Tissierellia bacterium]|nr:hypothetical protein [Tissierellia bacterium]